MKSRTQKVWIGLLSAALVALLLSACARRTPDAPLATATPGEMHSPTPSAPQATATPSTTAAPSLTPTRTPTLIPTPTPPPDVRLRLGRSLYQQGNYAAAGEQFRALLADAGATAEEAAEARYRLAQCYWRDGDAAAAADAWTDFIDAYPDDPRLPAAQFQQAEAHAALGEWPAAIAGYRAYLTTRDVVASAVYERIGDAYRQLDDDEQALESYEAALESAPYLDRQLGLREKMAGIYTRQEDYPAAIAQYQAILAEARLADYRAQIEYLLGQTYLLAGDAASAYRHWQDTVERYPTAHHAYLALVELVNAGVEVDEFQRGVVDLNAGVYGAAVQAFERYLASGAAEHRAEARYYAGRAYHLAGNNDQAIEEYDTVIAAYPQAPVAAEAWLAKARSLAGQGRQEAAIETLQAFLQAQPAHELAPEAWWRIAQLHENAAAWSEATTAYRQLAQAYPASERAAEALFRAGLSHFRLGHYQAAATDWQALVADYPDAERLTAGQYWLGRAYSALGNAVERDKWLAQAAASAAFLPDYYALRAAHRLEALENSAGDPSGAGWPAAQPNLLLDFNLAAAQAEVEAWLLSWVDPAGEMEDLSALPESLAQDPRYRRGVEYLALGLDAAALNEFETMRAARQDEPLILYGLALASRDLGVYQTSLRCALRVARLSPASSMSHTPRLLQRLAYPTYFDDLVLAEAAANNLDPLLVFALIRQESLFDPAARSYAQAIGLMQIVPATGEWIALRLNWPDFAPEQLVRPYLNVRFGAWFLAQGLNAFQGDVFAALAAYNSGLAAPRRWLDAASGDPDLFVETIDYPQTLHYVQLIYQHYTLYRHIYQPDA